MAACLLYRLSSRCVLVLVSDRAFFGLRKKFTITRQWFRLQKSFVPRFACLLACAALNGCHAISPAPSPITVRPAVESAYLSVQSQPFYKQAERACQLGQYAQAASLLKRLSATPGLSADQLAFCNAQRDLCLHHFAAPVVPAASSSFIPYPSSLSDCGPRALAIVCRQLGVKTEVSRLCVLAGTNAKGTSMAGLVGACKAVGLKAEGVQVSREALGEVELPAIAWVNQTHYIALLSVQGDTASGTATIADPNASGEQTIAREQLLRMCGGYLLLVQR